MLREPHGADTLHRMPDTPDARLARLALAALKAATTEAIAVAADLSPERALAALEALRAAGDVCRDGEGTWFVSPRERS